MVEPRRIANISLNQRLVTRPLFKIIAFFLVLTTSAPLLADECVVLLHGLWRSENSMNKMAKSLERVGYRVFNVPYESTDDPVGVLAEAAVTDGLAGCAGAQTVHFVTHSLGGILVRQYLENDTIEQLGRVVMLGPPNQGSEAVDRYASWPAYEWISGPAGQQLGTGEESVPRSLGPVSFDLGIIAGNHTFNPIISIWLPGKDDGKVTVKATRVEGMRDHLEMPVTHVFMMRNRQVISQVIYYLEHGQFYRRASGDSPGL